MESKTVTQQIEAVKEAICNDYCRYPMEEHDDPDRLWADGSPCENCPLNRL